MLIVSTELVRAASLVSKGVMPIFTILIFLFICGIGVSFLAIFLFALWKRWRVLMICSSIPAGLFIFYLIGVMVGPLWQRSPQAIYNYVFKAKPPTGMSFTHWHEDQSFFPGCEIYLELRCNEEQMYQMLAKRGFERGSKDQVSTLMKKVPKWWNPDDFKPDQIYVSLEFPGPYSGNRAILFRNSTNGHTFFFMDGVD